MKKSMSMCLVGAMLLITTMILWMAGAAHAQVTTYASESDFLAALSSLGSSTFQEGFEDDATWGSARFPSSASSITSKGITWTANNPANEITTGSGPARTGNWGFFSNPHGVTVGNPFDLQRDGFKGTSLSTIYGVGGWLTSNTPGAQVRFMLDGNAVDFNDPGVTSLHTFFGVIDTNGFTTFEIYETEGRVGDQKFIFADDFTFGKLTNGNSPPVANAGPDQTVFVNDTVTLDGSGSSDADGDSLTYSWSFTSRPAGSTASLSDSTVVNPTFVVDAPGTYVVQLIVNDGTVASTPDTVTISTENSQPVADAGSDQTALVGATVQLDGSGSSDADGDPLTYSWSFSSRPVGSTASLSDSTVVNPTFVVDVVGAYVVQLIVNDGSVDSGSNTVTITASAATNQPPDPPNLNSPGDGQPNVPLAPELATFGFSDPDGDTHIQTQWQVGTVSNFSSLIFDTTTDSHLTLLRIPEGVLDEDSVYYWRARFYDNRGGVSEWAVPFSFTTEPTMNDLNANGIPDDQEVDDTVDLDGDGTPDNFQNDIKSLNAATGTGQIGIKASTNVASIEMVESINPDDPALADQYDPANKPGETPVGLLSFKLQVFNVGGTAEAMVYFSPPLDSGTKWYKYDSLNGWQDYSAHATFSADGTWVRLQFQDGGFGDADGIDNGKICDPSGAVSSASSAAPSGGGGGGGGGCFITTAAFCSATLPGFTWLALHVRPYFALVPLFLLLLWMSIPLSIRLKRRRMRNIFR